MIEIRAQEKDYELTWRSRGNLNKLTAVEARGLGVCDFCHHLKPDALRAACNECSRKAGEGGRYDLMVNQVNTEGATSISGIGTERRFEREPIMQLKDNPIEEYAYLWLKPEKGVRRQGLEGGPVKEKQTTLAGLIEAGGFG